MLAAFFLVAQPAEVPAPAPVAMTCPIGGASFEYMRAPSAPVLGLRADGKPYGEGVYPPPLPECPDNGLILYKEYDASEVAKLTPFIATDEYRLLREQDTPYYRAYRLMRELGEAPDDYLWALLQASWEAESKPALRARYQIELIEAAAAVPPRPDDLQWIGMEGRAINALRELGQFDQAKARLSALKLDALDVTIPEGAEASEEQKRDDLNRRIWRDYFRALGVAIERQDRALEPFEMVPRRVALAQCVTNETALNEQQRAFCEAQRDAVAKLRAAMGPDPEEAELLARPREESGR